MNIDGKSCKITTFIMNSYINITYMISHLKTPFLVLNYLTDMFCLLFLC